MSCLLLFDYYSNIRLKKTKNVDDFLLSNQLNQRFVYIYNEGCIKFHLGQLCSLYN